MALTMGIVTGVSLVWDIYKNMAVSSNENATPNKTKR